MKNRILVLFSFMMAFAIITPTFAEAPVVEAKEVPAVEAPAVEAKEVPAVEAPAVEAKEVPAVKAPAVVKTEGEAASVTRQLLDAARGGRWAAVMACGIMLVVFVVNRVPAISERLGAKAKPWLAAATGIAGYIAAALMVDTSLVDAISGGFMTGASAVGLWEMVFKHFMKTAATASTT
jgi:hypothetical protein